MWKEHMVSGSKTISQALYKVTSSLLQSYRWCLSAPVFYCLLLWSQSAETQFPINSVFNPYSAVCLCLKTFVGTQKNCRNSFVRTEEVDSANSAAVLLFSDSILWKVIRERTQTGGIKYWTRLSGSQEHNKYMSWARKYFRLWGLPPLSLAEYKLP